MTLAELLRAGLRRNSSRAEAMQIARRTPLTRYVPLSGGGYVVQRPYETEAKAIARNARERDEARRA